MISPRTLPLWLLLVGPLQGQDLYDESVVQEIELTFHQTNWWSQLESNYGSDVEIPADLTMDGMTYLDVGVRFKGNTSYTRPNTQKKSFNISMNTFVADQDLLGYSTLNLNNAYMDPTFMREVLFSKACREFTTAAKGNFVHLTINNENWGIYANVQQLNKDFLEENYATDTGDRFKVPSAMRWPGKASLNWLGSNVADYQPYYELKTSDQSAYDSIVGLCQIIDNSPTGSTYIRDIEKVFNLDRALWTLALENCFLDSDGYVHKGSDYALYYDDVHKRWNLLQRDANEAFGSFGNNSWGTGLDVDLHPGYERNNPDLPLLHKVLNQPDAWERYLAHYRYIMETWLLSSKVDPIVDTWDGLIRAEVQADNKKIYSFSDYTTNLHSEVRRGNTIFHGLKQFVIDRSAYLSSLPEFNRPVPILSNLQHFPITPTADDVVTVTVHAETPPGTQLATVNVFIRTAGEYLRLTMHDDGQHQDGLAGDGVWGMQLPKIAVGEAREYYVSAVMDAADGGAWEFLPRGAEFQPHSYMTQGLDNHFPCINELMAVNDSTLADPDGEFDDWIELLNRDTAALDLNGFWLSDDPLDLEKWSFPAGTQVAPGETLLIWADDDTQQAGLHANFKLSGGGEQVFLTAPNGQTVIDAVAFGAQTEDVSIGRLFDGGSEWATLFAATPGASNEQSCGYRIFDQLNSNAHPISLTGTGSPSLGGAVQLTLQGLNPQESVLLAASKSTDFNNQITSAGVVFLNIGSLIFQQSYTADSQGTVQMQLPINNPALVGQVFYSQAYALNQGGSGALSNGVEIIICP